MSILLFLMSLAFANETKEQNVNIFIDLSEVHAPDGSIGTSAPLNIIVSNIAQNPYFIKGKLQYWSNPEKWNGSINIYDWTNIQHMPGFEFCNYEDAIACGIENKHWTLRTIVSVGEKYSIVTMKLYDETGKTIGNGSNTTWGHIRWKPKWKLTKVKEQSPFGDATKEIFELWPPEIQEIPPLIKPFNIRQASYGVYSVYKSACKTNYCLSK